jgi:hypothetical protein
MGDLAHRSDYLFETRCRAELDDRDPLGQADVFVRGSPRRNGVSFSRTCRGVSLAARVVGRSASSSVRGTDSLAKGSDSNLEHQRSVIWSGVVRLPSLWSARLRLGSGVPLGRDAPEHRERKLQSGNARLLCAPFVPD